MSFRFTAPTPLRWVDIDSAGIVNNAVYLNLMEQARYAYFAHLEQLRMGLVPFVLAEVTVRFLRPARLGMAVTTAVKTVRLGNTSFTMEYEVRDGDLVLAAGSSVLVFVDKELRPISLPIVTRKVVAEFEGIAERAS
ncbi:MAG: thioesterase family protein [Planctomycetota bacterium]|jgi:acyl-CoA thioester hydrolase